MSAATQGEKEEVGREAGSRREPEDGPDAGAGHSQNVRADPIGRAGVRELRRRAGRVFVASWAAEKNGEAGWSSCFQDFRARVVETLARHRHRLK